MLKRVDVVLLEILRRCPGVTVEAVVGAVPLTPTDEPVFHRTNAQLAVILRFLLVVLAHACVRWTFPPRILVVRRDSCCRRAFRRCTWVTSACFALLFRRACAVRAAPRLCAG